MCVKVCSGVCTFTLCVCAHVRSAGIVDAVRHGFCHDRQYSSDYSPVTALSVSVSQKRTHMPLSVCLALSGRHGYGGFHRQPVDWTAEFSELLCN